MNLENLVPISDNISTDNSRPIVFLDRDGTLIENIKYLSDPSKVVILPGVVAGLDKLKKQFQFVVVTNQSGVGRFKISIKDVRNIHQRIEMLFAQYQVKISEFIFCPHSPTAFCDCRKPRALMLKTILRLKNIDPEKCFLIGDSQSDVVAGESAKIRSFQLINLPENRRDQNEVNQGMGFKEICHEITKSIKTNN